MKRNDLEKLINEAKRLNVSTFTAQFEKELKDRKTTERTFEQLDDLKKLTALEYINGNYNANNLNDLAIYRLSKLVAHSIVAKLIDPQKSSALKLDKVSDSGLNPTMLQLRKDLVFDSLILENQIIAMNGEYEEVANKNGDTVTEYNEDDDRILNERASETVGEGMDLIHEAVVALLEQMSKNKETTDFDGIIEIEKPSKRVKISADDIIAVKTEESKPIVEVYRKCRRYISNNGSVKVSPNSKYTYIQDESFEGESGMEAIYRRSKKYADIGGAIIDSDIHSSFSGLYTASVSDFSEADKMESLIDSMKLSVRQREILELRLRGYSIRMIADKLGIKKRSVEEQIRRMGEKWNNR